MLLAHDRFWQLLPFRRLLAHPFTGSSHDCSWPLLPFRSLLAHGHFWQLFAFAVFLHRAASGSICLLRSLLVHHFACLSHTIACGSFRLFSLLAHPFACFSHTIASGSFCLFADFSHTPSQAPHMIAHGRFRLFAVFLHMVTFGSFSLLQTSHTRWLLAASAFFAASLRTPSQASCT